MVPPSARFSRVAMPGTRKGVGSSEASAMVSCAATLGGGERTSKCMSLRHRPRTAGQQTGGRHECYRCSIGQNEREALAGVDWLGRFALARFRCGDERSLEADTKPWLSRTICANRLAE